LAVSPPGETGLVAHGPLRVDLQLVLAEPFDCLLAGIHSLCPIASGDSDFWHRLLDNDTAQWEFLSIECGFAKSEASAGTDSLSAKWLGRELRS
jgi:hypothetical protein